MKSTQLNIFLVAKDHLIIEHYRQTLELKGYANVTPFDNPMECIGNLDQQPDVIFVNTVADPTFGLSFLKAVKTANSKVEVILLPGLLPKAAPAAVRITDYAFEYIISVLDRITVLKKFFNRDTKLVY